MSITKFTSVSVALFFLVTAQLGCFKKSTQANREVNLAIWGNYIAPDLVDKFTAQTGIKVNISNYASNEELLAKVQAGTSGIDVAVPSDYMVGIMTKLGLLVELDPAQLANSKLLLPELMHQAYDPENKYSLPYSWSTAGVAVNRDLYKGKITSWKDVFENPDLSGKLSLLDDVREVTAAALKMHGFSVNTVKPEELKLAEETMLAVKPRVKMFRSDTVEMLLKKEIAVAHTYSTDALQAVKKSGGKIEYILLSEGGTRAEDNLAIIKGSQHIKEAHALINFMLSPEANLSFVQTIFGGPILSTTRQKLPIDLQNNLSLFPPTKLMAKFEGIVDLGENTHLYDEIWTRVKSQ